MNKTEIKSYRDLIVWQKAHTVVLKILRRLKNYAKTEEARLVKNQIIRSATSMPANIAEGYGGQSKASFRNYLIMARRSANETDYWILLSKDLHLINEEVYNELTNSIKEIILMINSLIRKL